MLWIPYLYTHTHIHRHKHKNRYKHRHTHTVAHFLSTFIFIEKAQLVRFEKLPPCLRHLDSLLLSFSINSAHLQEIWWEAHMNTFYLAMCTANIHTHKLTLVHCILLISCALIHKWQQTFAVVLIVWNIKSERSIMAWRCHCANIFLCIPTNSHSLHLCAWLNKKKGRSNCSVYCWTLASSKDDAKVNIFEWIRKE